MDSEEERRDVRDEFLEVEAHLAGGFREEEEVGDGGLQRDGAGEVDVDGGIGDVVKGEGEIARVRGMEETLRHFGLVVQWEHLLGGEYRHYTAAKLEVPSFNLGS